MADGNLVLFLRHLVDAHHKDYTRTSELGRRDLWKQLDEWLNKQPKDEPCGLIPTAGEVRSLKQPVSCSRH